MQRKILTYKRFIYQFYFQYLTLDQLNDLQGLLRFLFFSAPHSNYNLLHQIQIQLHLCENRLHYEESNRLHSCYIMKIDFDYSQNKLNSFCSKRMISEILNVCRYQPNAFLVIKQTYMLIICLEKVAQRYFQLQNSKFYFLQFSTEMLYFQIYYESQKQSFLEILLILYKGKSLNYLFSKILFQYFFYRQDFLRHPFKLLLIIQIIKQGISSMFFKSIQQRILRNFCLINQPRNSLIPENDWAAYGYYFPKQWTQQKIYNLLDPSKKSIKRIQVIKTSVGTPSGKILFIFNTQQNMKKCIQKYNQDFIITKQSTHRVIIKPFQLKTITKTQQNKQKKTRNAVQIKNLQFDISKQELQRIAKDYGEVRFIDMHIRPNGLNNGMAIVYFKKRKQAIDFAYFCHGFKYLQRKLTAEVIQPRKQRLQSKQKELKQPQITLKAMQRLYKKSIIQQL